MFDIAIILTYFECFLGRLQPCLTRVGSAKAAFVKDVFSKRISIEDVFKNIYIGTRLFGANCWLLIK